MNLVKKYIENARNLSRKSKCTDWRIGAIIVKHGKVIGKGYNRYSGDVERISVRFNIDNMWSLHAEMAAVLNALENGHSTEGAIMYVAGKKYNGRPLYCKPCNNCMKVIKGSGMEAVYFDAKHEIHGIIFGDE